MARKKREYMMSPFRVNLDDDIRDKYFAIPEGKRSDTLRDAFRLYMGLSHKLVYEPSSKPLMPPTTSRTQNGPTPLIMKGVKR